MQELNRPHQHFNADNIKRGLVGRTDEIFISFSLLTIKLHDNGLTFKCLGSENPKGNLPYIISACFIQCSNAKATQALEIQQYN